MALLNVNGLPAKSAFSFSTTVIQLQFIFFDYGMVSSSQVSGHDFYVCVLLGGV